MGSFNTKLSSSSFALFFFIKYPLLSSLADIKVSVILTGYRSRIFLWQSCAMYNLLKLDPDNNLAEDQETEYFGEPIVYCVSHIFWYQKIREYSNPQLHCLWYLEHALQDLKPGTHKATDSNRRKKTSSFVAGLMVWSMFEEVVWLFYLFSSVKNQWIHVLL